MPVLSLGEQTEGDPSSDENAEGENPEGQDEEGKDEDARQDGESATTESAEAQDGETLESDSTSELSEDLSDAADPEDGAKPTRQEAPFSHQDEWGYKVFTAEFDEEIAAVDLCEPEELARLRNAVHHACNW